MWFAASCHTNVPTSLPNPQAPALLAPSRTAPPGRRRRRPAQSAAVGTRWPAGRGPRAGWGQAMGSLGPQRGIKLANGHGACTRGKRQPCPDRRSISRSSPPLHSAGLPCPHCPFCSWSPPCHKVCGGWPGCQQYRRQETGAAAPGAHPEEVGVGEVNGGRRQAGRAGVSGSAARGQHIHHQLQVAAGGAGRGGEQARWTRAPGARGPATSVHA